MNAYPRFPFVAGLESSSVVYVRGPKHAQLIGEENLRIPKALTNPPIEGSSASLKLATGYEPFEPKRELYRLLSLPPVYNAEQLREAEAVVERLSSCENEDPEIWAGKLAGDFSCFED